VRGTSQVLLLAKFLDEVI